MPHVRSQINDTLPAQNATIPATVQTWSYFVNDQIHDVQNSDAYKALPTNGGVKERLDKELNALSILLQMLALISQLANCQYLTDLYNALSDNVCGRMITGFFQMAHPDWIIGTLLVPGTAILIAVFRAEQPGDKEYNTGPATGITSNTTGGAGTSSTPQNNLFPGAGAADSMQMAQAQHPQQYAPHEPPPPVLAPAEPLKDGLMTGAFGSQSQYVHQPHPSAPAPAPYAPAPAQPGMMGGAYAYQQHQMPPPQQMDHHQMQPVQPQYGTIDPNNTGGGVQPPPPMMMDTYASQPMQQPIPSYVPSPAHADPNSTAPPSS